MMSRHGEQATSYQSYSLASHLNKEVARSPWNGNETGDESLFCGRETPPTTDNAIAMFRPSPSVEDDCLHPIVAQSANTRRAEIPAQSSLIDSLPGSTEASPVSGPEFGEQSHLPVHSDTPPQHGLIDQTRLPSSSSINSHQTTTITSNKITTTTINISQEQGDPDTGGLISTQSCLHTSGSVLTTSQETSYAGRQQNRTEETQNREVSHDSITENTSHRHHNSLQHPTPPNISLSTLTQPTPPLHSATAAEIALGISSPYNLRPDNRNQPTMAHDSRCHQRIAQPGSNSGDSSNNSKPESTSFVESLSEVKDRDEDNTSRTSETGMVTSPGRMTPLQDSSDHGPSGHQRAASLATIGTPSTVSTAPSTDDASLGTDYKLDDSFLPNLLQGPPVHHRTNSWGEEVLLPGSPMISLPSRRQDDRGSTWTRTPPGQPSPSQQSWGAIPQHPRVASFRDGSPEGLDAYGNAYPQDPNMGRVGSHRWPHQASSQHQQHYFPGGTNLHYHGHHNGVPMDVRQSQGYAQPNIGVYQQGPPRNKGYSGNSPRGGPSGVPPAGTPPRAGRGARPQGHSRQTPTGTSATSPHSSVPNPQRSSSEILKTLLRKKACLYEPDTSRSVALVTWLVGRELALEYGFFSRQQLQSGVHACVANKIDSGTITRTKVNRCMQIILNSCFHYIIPRSDGSEEKGDTFKAAFAETVQDDSFLLQYLPQPWNDLHVDKETVIEASLDDFEEKPQPTGKNPATPKSSPKVSSVNADKSPGKEYKDADDSDSKRAVLLCFNENVRSAEDVFRCHNEFIRDTANAAHLQLTAQEWGIFFGLEAASAPYLWGNVGIPVAAEESQSGQADVLGRLSHGEVGKFRTTWCTKRYDHDHDLCGFAHASVNGGWLRRNPLIQPHMDEMCQYVSSAGDKRAGSAFFWVNECPKGIHCEKAHSMEEVLYHPKRYKSKVCTAIYSKSGACRFGDVCPNLHPSDSARPLKKSSDRSHGSRHTRKNDPPSASPKSAPFTLPTGSPVVYASPAPVSSFEQHLGMPGLQNLYRRHSSVVRAYVRTAGKCHCTYSCFGDDNGISGAPPTRPESRPGLPPAPGLR